MKKSSQNLKQSSKNKSIKTSVFDDEDDNYLEKLIFIVTC